MLQLWSSKWSLKEEHKLLSELGGSPGTGNGATGPTGAGAPTGGYYDTHGGFPGVGAVSSAADLYDTISTMSQAGGQNLYSTPIAGSLGKYSSSLLFR